ncbi:DUF397 domain-containing protein [Streptomyces smyrnaeus]|uniref:DUF397 domain-containing protein n=1 Tax=Streptomyces smyrnaeus TaxID=1387713 RepID=UPI003699BD8B
MSTKRSSQDVDALTWFKSSYSGSGGGDCVEVAAGVGRVHVRDTKDRDGSSFAVPSGSWAAFVTYAAEASV